MFTWLREGTPEARRALLAACLGWALDAFDFMLYALVVAVLIPDTLSTTTAGLLGSIALVASGIGGVGFGLIADRAGRRPAMLASILVYSVFTAACGLAQNVWQFAVFRFLLGLGMGGEWTSGAAMVSETWPDKHRGKAVAVMQSSWAVGYAVAALVATPVAANFGWRAVFFIGIVPALLTLWIRRGVAESPVWLAAQKKTGAAPSATLRDVFRGRFASTTALLTILSSATIFAYWGLNLWVPAFLSLPVERGGLGFDRTWTTFLIVTMQVGTFLGYVSFGYIADAIGRRKSFVSFILIAAVLTLAYSATQDRWLLLALGPLVAFFGTGFFSGFGTVTAEIYPTSVRAVAQGFTFNVGRFASAAAPFMVGSLAQEHGFGPAFALLAGALLIGAATWIWLPETRGRSVA